ncbi:MAG: ester cyclase [Solirubrobacterales bacterium]
MEAEVQRGAREVAMASIEGAIGRDPDRIVAPAHPEGYVDDFVAIGEFQGKEAVRAFFGELFAAMPDFEMSVERVVADEGAVAVKWRAEATFGGAPFQGIQATGRRVRLRGVDFLEIEDGLIRRNTIFYDGASFARQIGMLPPEGSLADRTMLLLFNLKTRLLRPFRRR